jgi:hypothetical protein
MPHKIFFKATVHHSDHTESGILIGVLFYFFDFNTLTPRDGVVWPRRRCLAKLLRVRPVKKKLKLLGILKCSNT